MEATIPAVFAIKSYKLLLRVEERMCCVISSKAPKIIETAGAKM